MKKTKIILISVGAFVLILAALISVFGSISKNRSERSARSNNYMGISGMNEMALDNVVPEAAPKMMQESSYDSLDSSVLVGTEDKKVIKNGEMTLKVDEMDESSKNIGGIAKANEGDIFSSNFYKNNQNSKSGTIIVKVPVKNFEKAFAEIKKVASVVVRESTSGQDVTEQYQDLEGRIKNKQAEEEAYKKILTQAQKIDDILAITKSLSNVRGEIESLQGRLKYLASQTDMATITVDMSEDTEITVSDSWRPLQIAKEAVRSLVVKVQNFISFLIVFVVTFTPTLALYLLLAWVIYKIGRMIYFKFFKKKEEDKI